MKIVGFKHIVSKKDGIGYTELHLVSSDRFVVGVRCDVIFVRDDMITNIDLLSLDRDCQVFYNRFGKPESIVIVA